MEALVVLIGSFAISWVSVDLSIRAAKRVNAYDHPDGGRKVQERLWAIGASGELGQFFTPVAYRNNVKGLIKSPVQFFWNMSVE